MAKHGTERIRKRREKIPWNVLEQRKEGEESACQQNL